MGAVTLVPKNGVEVHVWDTAAIAAGDSPAAIPEELEFLAGG